MRCRALLALLVVITLALSSPGVAPATYEQLGSGTTKLVLDGGFRAAMKRGGVTLEALAPARLKGSTVSFPVSGGKLDPTDDRGYILHQGALLFRVGKRSIPLKALMLKTTQRRSPISAKVGGSQLKLGTAAGISISPAGFATRIRIRSLALSEKVAGRLGKKLRLPDAFRAGQPLGSVVSTAIPATVALRQAGRVSVLPDPAFRAKLDSLFVAWNPIFPAERPGGDFTFPILGGTLSVDATAGTVETLGSLDGLQLGGGQVFWTEPRFDFAAGALTAELEVRPSPPYRGAVGRTEIATISIQGSGVSADPGTRSIAVNAGLLTLTATAASALNEGYAEGKEVFTAGERLGSVSLVGVGQ